MVLKKDRDVKVFLISILVVVFFLGEIALSFSEKTPEPIALPFDTSLPLNQRLSNELSQIDGINKGERKFERFLKKWHIKGASVAIVKDGRLVYAKGFGYANEENKERANPGHLFRIASVSKLITAVTIMKMQEDSLLELDSKVFGEKGILNDSIYRIYKDKRFEEVTVKHLLQHSAGWYNRYGDHMFIPTKIQEKLECEWPVSVDNTIKFALLKKLHFKPGARSSYSNLGYAILGKVIEKISGMPYEDYVKANVLRPLGIYDMHIGKNLYADKYMNEVRYYEQDDAIKIKSLYGTGEMVLKSYGGNNVENLAAAGGWVASPVELMRLLVAIDGFETKPDFLNTESIKQMIHKERGISAIGWKGVYGNGYWWRTGTLAGSSALMKRQADGIGWVVLVNTSAWNGSKFPNEINKAMTRMLRTVNEWPEYDLFTYYPNLDGTVLAR